MEFLKKHYEKILLSVVLAALAVAAAALPLQVSSVHTKLQEVKMRLVSGRAKPMEPFDLSTNETLLARLSHPPSLDLSGEHNVFSPVKWERLPDGSLRKLNYLETGAYALVITNIQPLHLVIAYDGTVGLSDPPRYRFTVTKESASRPQDRRPKTVFAQPGTKAGDTFVLKEVVGPADAPTELILELLDDQQTVVVSSNSPFSRIEGYMADLKYQPKFESDARTFTDRRVGDKLQLSKTDYKIVSISENEVVVEEERTTKRTTIRRRY
jgi:hypothetical protein